MFGFLMKNTKKLNTIKISQKFVYFKLFNIYIKKN